MAQYGNWFENAKNVLAKIANINAAGDTFTGDVTGVVIPTSATYDASGAIDATIGRANLDSSGGALAMTLAGTSGQQFLIHHTTAGNNAVVTFTGATLNAAGNNTATFNAAGEALLVQQTSSSTFIILSNVGSVALTTV